MRILGIETSGPTGSLSLVEDGRVLGSVTHELPNAHAEQLMPMLERVLQDVAWHKSTLDRIAVGTGPGSFTGLRVGIALAQGVALGLGCPLLGIPSLEALAHAGRPYSEDYRYIVPLMDARRNEAFVAVYSPAGVLEHEPRAVPMASLSQTLKELTHGEHFLPLGALAHLVGPVADGGATGPHASDVALLAQTRTPCTEVVSPQYVREADAIKPSLAPNPLAGVASS